MTKSIFSSKRNSVQISEQHRDEYGALRTQALLSEAISKDFEALLDLACSEKLMASAGILEATRTSFHAINHSVMDVLLERQKVRAFVVQVRDFSRNKRGYTRLEKTYILVRKLGRKLTAETLDGATCARRAKNASALGQLVRHYLGAETLACKAPRVQISTGYKILAQTPDGGLASVFDQSIYTPQVWRTEAARPGHQGGFYHYTEREHALEAAHTSSVFASGLTDGKKLVLCRVEVSGKRIAYGHGKLAASRLRVTEVMETLTT
jgi:hypothetical protein